MKNILILVCDQLSFKALRAYGNTYAQTPSIDSLAEKGIVFDRAYTNCPLCQPARASFWSSSYPHQNGVISNLPKQQAPEFPAMITTLGELFAGHGYECVHFGKEHDYGALRGFTKIENAKQTAEPENPEIPYDYETFFDLDTTEKAVNYFTRQVPDLTKPFLTVVDLQNPHNICGYIGAHDNTPADFAAPEELPELPENFEDTDWETRSSFFRFLCCGHRRQSQTTEWSRKDFQHYLFAYHYYLSKVDQQIGQVLEALSESGKAKETLIVFFADHGEGMAAHKIVTKSGTFYEETVHVPFILAGQALANVQPQPLPRRYAGLTSLLDLLPTLAEYADLPIPESAAGKSQWGQIAGGGIDKKIAADSPAGREKSAQSETDNAAYVVSQWHDEFEGYFVPGRMYLDEKYKYIAHQDKNGLEEELYDLHQDPLEQRNLAAFAEYQKVVADYRQKLKGYADQTKDPFFSLKPEYSEIYRNHPPHQHSGPNVVLDYQERVNAMKNK